jgi:hypothetical protein
VVLSIEQCEPRFYPVAGFQNGRSTNLRLFLDYRFSMVVVRYFFFNVNLSHLFRDKKSVISAGRVYFAQDGVIIEYHQ